MEGKEGHSRPPQGKILRLRRRVIKVQGQGGVPCITNCRDDVRFVCQESARRDPAVVEFRKDLVAILECVRVISKGDKRYESAPAFGSIAQALISCFHREESLTVFLQYARRQPPLAVIRHRSKQGLIRLVLRVVMDHGPVSGWNSEPHGQLIVKATQDATWYAPRNTRGKKRRDHKPHKCSEVRRSNRGPAEPSLNEQRAGAVHLDQTFSVNRVQEAADVPALLIIMRESKD